MNKILAELWGGPHDGHKMPIPQLHDHLDSASIPGQRTPEHDTLPVRYRLDPTCLDHQGSLVTEVARYLWEPPAPV